MTLGIIVVAGAYIVGDIWQILNEVDKKFDFLSVARDAVRLGFFVKNTAKLIS